MMVYLVLVFTVIGVFLISTSVGFFVLCCCDPRNKGQEYEQLEDNQNQSENEAEQQRDH